MPNVDLSAVEERHGFELPRSIGHGGRNDTLHAYASSMQARGVGDAEMLDALLAANESRCDPPLPEWEVMSVWRSVTTSYAKGSSGGRVGGRTGSRRGFPIGDPPKVSGAGHPELLTDLSGMSPAEQARAWVGACFDPDDVVCLTRDFRDPSQEWRMLAGQLMGMVDGFDPLPSMLAADRGMGWWAITNPLRSLDSPRRDAEVGRMEATLAGVAEVALPDGGVGTTRSWSWAEAPAYHHALVECDGLPPDEQLERICALFLHGTPDRGRLPSADAITWSGGKSWHVLVRCGGRTREEYDDRVRWLYAYCDDNGLPVDHHCGNPARLTRLPGARRGGDMQRLAWFRGC